MNRRAAAARVTLWAAGVLSLVAVPAWATDPNPTGIDLTGPLQGAQTNLFSLMQQALPFIFQIFTAIVAVALLVKLVGMIAGSRN